MNPSTALALALLPLTAVAAQTDRPLPATLELAVGAQLVLDVTPVQRLSVGDARIADVKPLEHMQLLVIGLAEGETTLTLWIAGEPRPKEIRLRVGNPKAVAPTNEERVTLTPGQQKVFTPGGRLVRVAVGDTDVVDVKVIGHEQLLLVAGKSAGETTLIVWGEGGARKSFVLQVR